MRGMIYQDTQLNSAVLYYLRILLAVTKFLALAEVSLVSQHLIVDLVVDVEQLGDDLPVLEDADQLHDPPLHLLAGPSHLGQQRDVLWVFLWEILISIQ